MDENSTRQLFLSFQKRLQRLILFVLLKLHKTKLKMPSGDLANFKLYKNIPLNKRWVNLVLKIKFVILEFQPKISIKGSQNPENISKPFHLQKNELNYCAYIVIHIYKILLVSSNHTYQASIAQW